MKTTIDPARVDELGFLFAQKMKQTLAGEDWAVVVCACNWILAESVVQIAATGRSSAEHTIGVLSGQLMLFVDRLSETGDPPATLH
jgi:hypothetical protein